MDQPDAPAPIFSATTRGISVRVEPSYLPAESAPDESRYMFAYRVTIANNGPITVQLVARRWEITNGRGLRREVNGLGVVGEQPILGPGQSFEYTSGCPLDTATGFMVGSYRMVTENGDTFDVAIPAFSLDCPDPRRTLN